MSLPIDESAIEAQHAAEHEYGERLMSAAEYLAACDEAPSVTAEHIGRAVRWLLGTGIVRLNRNDIDGKFVEIGPQRAAPKSVAQLKAIAKQAKDIVERAGIEAAEDSQRLSESARRAAESRTAH